MIRIIAKKIKNQRLYRYRIMEAPILVQFRVYMHLRARRRNLEFQGRVCKPVHEKRHKNLFYCILYSIIQRKTILNGDKTLYDELLQQLAAIECVVSTAAAYKQPLPDF